MGWTLLAALFFGCAPPVSQVSADRYQLDCEFGLAQCKQMAANVCPAGFEVIEAKTGASGGGAMLVRCGKSNEERWRETAKAGPPEPAPSACPPAMPKGVECVRNFQCAEAGARCIDGKCVAPEKVVTVDPADRCMVGAAGDTEPTPLFPSAEAVVEFSKTKSASKASTLALVTKLGGTWVDPGVRCKTLEQGEGRRRVQLVSGPLAGREGWLYGAGQFTPASSIQ